LIGNLYWPNEIDRFTPTPDRNKNIWFARDINEIAAELKTEPFLIVARNISPEDPNVMMLPVSVDRIPNNHLQYAITWFLLAFVWLGMTLYFLWRMKPIKHC
jgi:surfeit locus 1 family protein